MRRVSGGKGRGRKRARWRKGSGKRGVTIAYENRRTRSEGGGGARNEGKERERRKRSVFTSQRILVSSLRWMMNSISCHGISAKRQRHARIQHLMLPGYLHEPFHHRRCQFAAVDIVCLRRVELKT
eukprot:738963-Hanusia_phi.AAC.3